MALSGLFTTSGIPLVPNGLLPPTHLAGSSHDGMKIGCNYCTDQSWANSGVTNAVNVFPEEQGKRCTVQEATWLPLSLLPSVCVAFRDGL